MFLRAACLALIMAVINVNAENCDPGNQVPRNDVVLTDIAFDIATLELPSSTEFTLDINYSPEQVVPFDFRSAVYAFAKKQDGSYASGCGWGFDFGTGAGGAHSSLISNMGRNCVTETGDLTTYPQTYEGTIDYWVCLGETTASADACARVNPLTAGFDNTNLNSLQQEHYCKKFSYDLQVSVSSGGVDAIVEFVMEYIRDPIDTEGIVEFFDATGAPATLEEVVEWAVCDYNDLGDIQYEECIARMAVNPPPRVLDLSTPTETNPFSTVFGLQGATDRSLVSNEFPLSIDLAQSLVRLYHADYAGDYSTCDVGCTDATAEVASSLVLREYGTSVEIPNNYQVALEGGMPVFDELSDQNCDQGFCTLVLVLNFQSKFTRRERVLKIVMPFGSEGAIRKEFVDPNSQSENPQYRMLQESAVQGKASKVKGVRTGSSADLAGVLAGVGAGLVALVAVGAAVYKKRRSPKSTEKTVENPESETTSQSDELPLEITAV